MGQSQWRFPRETPKGDLSCGDLRETRQILASQVRRGRAPAQTRTFDRKSLAQQWARTVEGEIDNGVLVDRRAAERTSLAQVLERYRCEVTPTKRGSADEDSSSVAARFPCRTAPYLRPPRRRTADQLRLPVIMVFAAALSCSTLNIQ